MRKNFTNNTAATITPPARTAPRLRRMMLPLALGAIAGNADAATIPTMVGSLISNTKREIVANIISSTKPSWLLENWSVKIEGVVKIESGESGSAVLHLPVMENGKFLSVIFDGANATCQLLVDGELPQDFNPVPNNIPAGTREIHFLLSIHSPNAATQLVKFAYAKPNGENVVQMRSLKLAGLETWIKDNEGKIQAQAANAEISLDFMAIKSGTIFIIR